MDLDTEIWNRIGNLIEAAPKDGLNADGSPNAACAALQDGYINGLRMARMAAIAVVREAKN